jgi:hypothetical protein
LEKDEDKGCSSPPHFLKIRPPTTPSIILPVHPFLKHVINVILSNHHITTDISDLRDILSYYGDVDMRTSKEVVKTRGVKKGLCGNVDVDEVMEIVSKILVNGVNIAKRVPELVEYIQQLGISL